MLSIIFNYHTSRRLLRNDLGSVSYKNLEKLCLIFNCTPDDLFSWSPDQGKSQDKVALKKLSGRVRKGGNILDKLKQLPEDKLEQIRQFVDKVVED